MKASVSKKSFILAMAIGLLGVSMPEWSSTEARPPRGRPTSPVGTRAVKGIKNLLGMRTPSHLRPRPPAAAAVGQRPAGSRRNVRRLDSRGRVVRGSSRPSLHGPSRGGSRQNLRRASSRNVRNQYEAADARIWTSVPANAASVSTYGQAPAGPSAATNNTVSTYGRSPSRPGAPNTVATYGQAPGPGLPPSGYVAPPPLPGGPQPRAAHGQLPVRMPTNSAPRGQ